MKRSNGSKSAILREAETVADAYFRSALLPPRRSRGSLPPGVWAAAGAVGTAAAMAALRLLHIL